MIPLASPPSPPSPSEVRTHLGGSARGRAAAAVVLASLFALASCTASGEEDASSTSTAGLSARVSEFLEQNDEHDKVKAVLVYEDGEPVLELYNGEDAKDYLNLRSVTKSVVSTLIGIAIDEGRIPGVDATLGDLLPAHSGVMNAEVAAIPLHRILTHTAGFPGEDESDWYAAPDTIGFIITDRVERGPGDGSFEYSDAGSHVLAAILDQATDGSVLEFARTQLFDPLGIDSDPAWAETDEGTPEERAATAEAYLAADFAWPIDPQGIHAGWAFMKLRPEDMAKLGLLYLDDGDWKGESLVSSDWVKDATTPQVDTFTTPSGYGYQWWTHTEEGVEMFLALGYAGNLIAVVPDRDLVAVVASEFDLSDPLAHAEAFDEGQAITMLQYVILAQPE